MITELEKLEQEIYDLGIHLDEKILAYNDAVDGLYICTHNETHIILLNRHRPESYRAIVLAEELGHYYTACGDIVNQAAIQNRKVELRGHRYAYRRLIPQELIYELIQSGARAFHEMAEELCLPEYFIREAYAYYLVAV